MGVITFKDDTDLGIARYLFRHILAFCIERSDNRETFERIAEVFDHQGCWYEIENMSAETQKEFITFLNAYVAEKKFEETHYIKGEVESLVREIIKKMS